MPWLVADSAQLGGLAGSDQCEELVRTLLDHLSWTSSMNDELDRQRPVGGDLQTVRQQIDTIQVITSGLLTYLLPHWFCIIADFFDLKLLCSNITPVYEKVGECFL